MSDGLLDAAAIMRLLDEVAEELPPGGMQHLMVVVGGALLAFRGLRDATRDVDSGIRLDAEVLAASERVAGSHGLSKRWINDSAAAFLPATFELADCVELLDRPTLRVLGVSWNQLFLMKLNASRAVDTDDIEAIWPHCAFGSAEAAVEAFYEAYPLERHDEFLADRIRAIV